MKKISEKLLVSMAKDWIEDSLDRNDEFFYEYINDIAEQEEVNSEELADKLSIKLSRVIKSIK